ncbi:MAG: biotin--[acetyl-CoA-carboxylase] ligase [Lachnospiraceae bacterium]|nr:biotin--[acetyl-CoA-carboxylase] ligase [Lachnospiraceae bacterium]
MGTKEKLLFLFESQKGAFFSGEEIAEKLSVSRTAVWKAVNSLRKEGYDIEAVPNKGYSLSVTTDILSVQGIRKYLSPVCSEVELNVLPEVETTNALLREKANAGATEGYTVIAGAQTKGRGRLGRSFFSPEDTGIYMSLLLRPVGMTPSQAIRLTTMAAVAACEAIEEASGKQAWIKWVNDIYMDGRKVSGILTEASFNMETGSLDYVVLGIGMNVYPPKGGFPKEIEQIAGTIFHERRNDGKNFLAAGFLNCFMNYYVSWEKVDYVEKYRTRCLVTGKEITVVSAGGGKRAVALDVDEECRLVVRYTDGQTEHLSSGEISISLNK